MVQFAEGQVVALRDLGRGGMAKTTNDRDDRSEAGNNREQERGL
jgi:hypothetical protein